MTAILGISAFYHDSAAALVVDGRIVAAAQEERFTRKKHDSRFPQHAIDYCLTEAGLRAGDLDYVGFYDKPLVKFERLLETYLSYAPRGFRSFLDAMPSWLRQKLYLQRELNRGLRAGFGAATSSPSITNRTPPAHSFPRPSMKPPSSRWTAWANGPRPRSVSVSEIASR